MSAAVRRSRQSMALVITLAILALLSILLVSFVSMAALDRGSTKSYAQSLQADQIAQGGLDQIVSQFQAEIADPALSTNYSSSIAWPSITSTFHWPAPTPCRNAPRPRRRIWRLCSAIAAPICIPLGQAHRIIASSSLSQTASLNSRVVSIARWNKPQLTTSVTGFPNPAWVLVTRVGTDEWLGSDLRRLRRHQRGQQLGAEYQLCRRSLRLCGLRYQRPCSTPTLPDIRSAPHRAQRARA